jgi:hypothetical protein
VNRAKLKFSKINTTTSRVSVRNIIESAREGAKQTHGPSELSLLKSKPGTKLPRKGHHTIGASCLDYN